MSSAARRSSRIGWFVAGYAGLAGFFALEGATRQRGAASQLTASADDDGTTRLIVAAYAVGVLTAPILRALPAGALPRNSGPAGVALQVVGLTVRAWSMQTLGRSYSRTLTTNAEQRVVDSGPYAAVRHPGYLGSLLTWTGFALTSGSAPVVAVVAGLMGRAYWRRITAEERLLRRDLPGYAEYSDRTQRLIPFVW